MAEESDGQARPIVSASDQERHPADDFFTIYANNVAVSFSSWDVSLIFGEIIGVRPDGKPIVEEIGKVIMSREFTKLVSQVLALNVAAYEQNYGEIVNRHFQLSPDAATLDFSTLKKPQSTKRTSKKRRNK